MKIFNIELSRDKREEEFIKKIQGKAMDYFIANYSRLPKENFVMGAGLHNHRCFYNAVQHATQDESTVHLCFVVENLTAATNNVMLHVINKTKDGKWQDNTLGYFYRNWDYYYIKEILPDCYQTVWDWFEDMRKRFVKQFGGEDGCKKYDLKSSELF